MEKNKELFEIDFIRIGKALWRKAWLLILALCIGIGAGYSYSYYMIQPQYQSDVLLYVNASSISLGGTKVNISSAAISEARTLLDTYVVILQSRSTLNMVIEEGQLECSANALKGMISAGSVSGTEVMSIVVTTNDPVSAEKIANVVAKVLPERISQIIEGTSVQIIDYAIIPSYRCSPSYMHYAEIGGALVLLIAAAFVILQEILDDRITDENYLLETYSIPLLAVIPDLETNGRGYYKHRSNYYYKNNRYGYAKEYENAKQEQSENSSKEGKRA